ncbi:unnamed protein product [Ilex paraguariensis]|uniref:Transmembrane protein n=1 Tax=Ilex paraguariensis TaxID=185542 RepID=A0ABC8TAU3_9AQUA
MCRGSSESVEQLLLNFGLSWVFSRAGVSLLEASYGVFGKGCRVSILWECVFMVILWVVWLERNNRILEGKEENVEFMCARAKFLISFWASTTKELYVCFYFLSIDWIAASCM